MRPAVPESGHAGAQFFEIGLGQDAYQVLPGYKDAAGLVLTEWTLTPEEAFRLAAGARLRLWVHTFGQPLQPVSLEVVVTGGEA